MKLLRTVINIHEKKVIQKEILNKVIFVKTLFVSYKQVLDLKCSQFTYHVNIIAAALCKQNVL